MRKGVRKHGRVTTTKKVTENLTMTEMFERFMWFKQSEGLAARTMEEYHIHFKWLLDFTEQDLSKEEITLEVFLEWNDFLKNEKGPQPTKDNIQIRTMRAFLHWCFLEQLIDEPIHEKFKPMKTAEDNIGALTVTEIKNLLNPFDEERLLKKIKIPVYNAQLETNVPGLVGSIPTRPAN